MSADLDRGLKYERLAANRDKDWRANLEKAREAYLAASSSLEVRFDALLGLARVARDLGDKVEAARWAWTALEIGPRRLGEYVSISFCLPEGKGRRVLRSALREMVSPAARSEVAYWLSVSYRRQGKRTQRLRWLRTANEAAAVAGVDVLMSSRSGSLATALEEEGAFSEARILLERAADIGGVNSENSVRSLVRFSIRRGELGGARAALRRHAGSMSERVRTIYSAALMALQGGKPRGREIMEFAEESAHVDGFYLGVGLLGRREFDLGVSQILKFRNPLRSRPQVLVLPLKWEFEFAERLIENPQQPLRVDLRSNERKQSRRLK